MAINYDLFRSRLEIERKHIMEDLGQLTADAHPIDERREGSPFGKREEEATETAEWEKRLAVERRLRGLLADIEHALAKIEKGTYGRCDNCGKLISQDRLEALPQASLCMSCKAELAKNAKGN